MKALLFALCLLTPLAFPLAREIEIEWDPNPAEEGPVTYKVEQLEGSSWIEAGATTELGVVTLKLSDFPEAATPIRIFAVNANGLSSPPSESYIVYSLPSTPSGLRVKVTVTIEVQ